MYDSVVPIITIGMGIDSTAAADISSVEGDNLAFSNPRQLFDYYYETDNLATYEGDGIQTSVSANVVVPPISSVDAPPFVGVWSRAISDASGTIDYSFTVNFNNSHSSAISFYLNSMDAEGSLEIYLNGTLTQTIPFTTSGSAFVASTVMTFDKFIIHFTKTTQPYVHVKLAEIEFGTVRSLSNSELTDTINVIEEVDLMQSSIPLNELDFSLINVDGKYDIDNVDEYGHNKDLEDVAVGTPVALSFKLIEGATETIHVLGRYIITRHNADEDKLQITAQDYRTVIQNKSATITLDTTVQIASSISIMLSTFSVPHVIEDSARNIYPTRNYTFKGDSALTQLLYIQQMYEIFVVPGRDGNLHIVGSMPSGTATPLTQDLMVSYPKPSLTTIYNYITIDYGDSDNRQSYNRDLRTDPYELVGAFIVDNPLVYTQEEAEALADRIEDMMFTQLYSAEAIGDPTFETFKEVAIEGRFSAGNPLTYRINTLEFEYDGGLTMRLEGVR